MGFLKLGKRTIGSRIASLVTFSVLSAMFILAIFLSLLQLQQSVDQKRQALESTAYIYASALADDIESQNSSEAQHVLRSIARVPNILHAAAINNRGETIAEMGSLAFLTSDQISGQPSTIELLTKGNLPVAVDIIRGGETVGKLVVLGDIRDIRTQLLWTLFTTAIASIAAALLAFPISAPLQRRIVNPITSLTSAMKLMRETRTFKPTEVDAAEGETRVLVETFNSMVEDLHSRDSALQRLAYFDPLTGLPNRVNFQRILNDAVENKLPSAAVYIFDIDNFHAINDAMGHSIGDALLMDVSARLKAEAPADGQLCRIGGDEFALFAPGIRTITEAQDALAKMIASLYPPVNILGHEVHISASTGVVMVPQHAARTTAQWVALLEDKAVPCGPINDIGQAFSDAQVQARGLAINQVVAPVGIAQTAIKTIASVASPLRLMATPPVLRNAPPALGEHTDAVLAELGLDGPAIAQLREAGVV